MLSVEAAPGEQGKGDGPGGGEHVGEGYVLVGAVGVGEVAGAKDDAGDVFLRVPGEVCGGGEANGFWFLAKVAQRISQVLDGGMVWVCVGWWEGDVAQAPCEFWRVVPKPGVVLCNGMDAGFDFSLDVFQGFVWVVPDVVFDGAVVGRCAGVGVDIEVPVFASARSANEDAGQEGVETSGEQGVAFG